MSDPTFGISITRIDNEPRPAVYSDMSIVGLVGTAPDANATTFPADTPVFMYSDDATMLAALGDSGTLKDAVSLLNAQLGEFQVAAKLVIVRVAEGVDTDATITNIVGNGSTTGLWALDQAGPLLGHVPRLIGVPGFTSQAESGVTAVAIGTAGTGYEVGDAITGTGGGGTGFDAEVATVGGSGEITSVTINDAGTGYTSAPTLSVTTSGGSGAALTASAGLLANPVCAALPAILSRLLAHAVVDGPATTQAAGLAWRETISSERIIPVDPAVKVYEDGSTVVKPMSPGVLGIAVRRDYEKGGFPFHSWANQAMQGILGPSRPINFSLTDGATEGQTLLAANVGILTRGEMGVASAIGDGGFIFIGTDNAGSDDLWQFYNVTRGRDFIHLMLLNTLRFYLGRFNITGQTVQAVINTMNLALRDLKANGSILGYEVSFDRNLNTPESLRLGRLKVSFAAEEAPVLRYLGIQSARYRPALDALLEDILVQTGIVTG